MNRRQALLAALLTITGCYQRYLVLPPELSKLDGFRASPRATAAPVAPPLLRTPAGVAVALDDRTELRLRLADDSSTSWWRPETALVRNDRLVLTPASRLASPAAAPVVFDLAEVKQVEVRRFDLARTRVAAGAVAVGLLVTGWFVYRAASSLGGLSLQ